ncbi:MAG: hypothetical protein ACOCRK_05180 [bacterium]
MIDILKSKRNYKLIFSNTSKNPDIAYKAEEKMIRAIIHLDREYSVVKYNVKYNGSTMRAVVELQMQDDVEVQKIVEIIKTNGQYLWGTVWNLKSVEMINGFDQDQGFDLFSKITDYFNFNNLDLLNRTMFLGIIIFVIISLKKLLS